MSTPEIQIEPNTVLCAKHLERFREHWPFGYLTTSIAVVHQILNYDKEVIQGCGGAVEMITATLREYGPLCERLADEVIEEIITASLSEDSEDWKCMMMKYGPPPPGGWK